MNDKGKTWRALVARYRELVQAEPSEDALRGAVKLAQDVASVNFKMADVNAELVRLDEEDDLASRLESRLSEDVLEFARSRLEADAVDRSTKRKGLARKKLLREAAFAMLIPSFDPVRKEVSERHFVLLLDTCLVIFHQVFFGYLSDGRMDPDDRTLSLQAAVALSEALPPPDRARLRALVSEASGDPLLADMFYREALASTDPKSHEFMSVLQSAWASLTEQRRFADALLLLDSYARRVQPADVGEFEELVLETIRTRRAA